MLSDCDHAGGVARKVKDPGQDRPNDRSLIEANPDALVLISPDGVITDVNEGTIRLTGIPRESIVGTDFSDHFTDATQARHLYATVLTDGILINYSLVLRHDDGHLIDVAYSAGVYRDSAGGIRGVCATARDVTETKRVMREFSETKTLLDNIFRSSARYSIIGKDLENRIVSWNEGARRNYRYEAEDVVGHNAQMLHTPEDVASGAVADIFAAAFAKGVAEGEFERVRRDGTRFWANLVVTRRNDAVGSPIGYLLMSNDITESKQAEERARTTSLYARSLIEATLDPLVTISPDGKITDANEATADVTGVPRETLVGTDFSDYFTEPENAREVYQQVFAKGFVTGLPLTIRHRDRTLTEVMYNASVYKETNGNVLGVFAVARDITGQRKAEAEIAEQRSKELDRLAELERFQRLTVGRELKMIELKKEIRELQKAVARRGIE
jgi:PAS domain S-box-containing protein